MLHKMVEINNMNKMSDKNNKFTKVTIKINNL